MQENRFLRSLRSVRAYSPQPVPEDVLSDILETARWTGSGKNIQPWELIVVRDPARLVELATLGRYAGHLNGAALAIVIVTGGVPGGHELDAGRLAQNIMLAAWAHGVGSCIGSIGPAENEQRARSILGVPDDRTVRTTIALGFPAGQDAHRFSHAPENVQAVVRPGRRPLSEMARWERYDNPEPSRGDR